MEQRNYKRINITLPHQLNRQLDAHVTAYNWSRSGIIQLAISQWLQCQPPLPTIIKAKTATKLIAGMQYDADKNYTDYVRSDMTQDQIINTLLEFEAARQQTGRSWGIIDLIWTIKSIIYVPNWLNLTSN